ncbi:cytochrome P450 monooxygenase [Tamaricihabitans halophyticus]|uniref:Cytochrome P450 monooxygenase n=1 Tax=Tamaricihabitans halophyticus TaxID=1262583 RepID=A0A4R2QDG1_9PSEU|nr:cytochrome P450 [Tamaricihabitans halophyticus]TCP45031.1 cytochrome P450 monooxygenase [Tamaricihabitans halophyticus]
MAIGSELVEFPVRRPGEPFPPPQYADYRSANGMVYSIMPTGSKVWLATRYADVRTVLTDKRISSNPKHEGFPSAGRTGGVPGQDEIPGWFVALDPPEHDRFRKALIPEFTIRRIRELRPAIQEVVDDVLDNLAAKGGEADLVRDFTGPVPSLVIAALLGVPKVDRPFFEEHIRALVSMSATHDERENSTKYLLRYLNRLIKIKQHRPGDDLLSVLIKAGTLSVIEMSGAALLLLIAGQETTANNMALGMTTLLLNRQWIGDDRVVEEVLRYYSVANIVALRVATEDLEIGGQQIKAGDGIVPLLASANHDDSTFECPHAFDPTRSARHHVAFGFGVHQCLGQNLVRAELDIAYRSLFERLPDLELAVPAAELPFRYDGVIFGLEGLPVRWRAAETAH